MTKNPPSSLQDATPPSVGTSPAALVLLGAAAGGMGWGIRGQYGHETGAMIAGVLVGFVLLLALARHLLALQGARVVALIAVGISIGGSMTYGQTIGLTQDGPLIGNWEALRWGMLGLFIKGGIWIGFAGVFLGMGLSGKRYGPGEVTLVLAFLLLLQALGMRLLNSPFDPTQKILPTIYFSDDWYWEPEGQLKPRPECWGGLLFALLGLLAYVAVARRDGLARNLGLIGFVFGGLGFSLGQCLQAAHAWNPEFYRNGLLGRLDPYMNWWNMMETTFGAIMGAGLAFGLWRHRAWIRPENSVSSRPATLSAGWEGLLYVLHTGLLVAASFVDQPTVELYLEYGLVMSVLPLIGILGGRYWPYLFPLVVVAIPITGKTLRELSYKHEELSRPAGWLLLVVLPLTAMLVLAMWWSRRGERQVTAAGLARTGLLATTWLYFGLNFAFFRWPWPWAAWTGRTPSGIIFSVCAIALTLAAWRFGRSTSPTVSEGSR